MTYLNLEIRSSKKSQHSLHIKYYRMLVNALLPFTAASINVTGFPVSLQHELGLENNLNIGGCKEMCHFTHTISTHNYTYLRLDSPSQKT
jgi:hypothetical protein